MTTSRPLFQPATLGALTVQNRIAMAPMTRSRAHGNVPNDAMRTYYHQRASAGLIVSEGTAPAPEGLGYARIPGIFSAEQTAGWRNVIAGAHAGGARFFVQLMHTGRVGHAANLPAGAEVIAPSAIAAAGTMWTDAAGMQPMPVPRAMDAADLERVKAQFVQAARNAVAAGADGVELHAANGYLLNQFLNPRSNQRTDRYGGSAENRQRFVLEVVDATIAAIGANHVAIRLSPFNGVNDLAADYEGESAETMQLVRALAARGLAYLHLIATPGKVPPAFVREVRDAYPGTLMLAGDFNGARAEAALAEGLADLIAFGRPFIANPDLPQRLQHALPLADFDPAALYAPTLEGYNDYPPHPTRAAA